MPKTIKPFDEIRVRKFPYEQKIRLIKMADQQKKSLQQFLYDELIALADRQKIFETQHMMATLQKETNEVVVANTKLLMEVSKTLRYLTGEEEDNE